MAADTDNGNGRVTMALLAQQQKHILEKLDANHKDTKDDMTEVLKCATDNAKEIVQIKIELAHNQEQHTQMKRDNRIFSSVEAGVAAVLGLVGIAVK